jgi:hypothetical protein
MMDLLLILKIVDTALAIQRRHFALTGELLDDARVEELLRRELLDGTSAIMKWFQAKGLPVPE